ncbi:MULTISPECIES: tetratricopeptide repeat protein [unclassified Massilia]|uniref:tetratricopeptide repeat protein n=1 Tax=unclassified Massilia TaxID=2609279 RepID=UPI0017876153|nr:MULTISPECIES: tetratricopeptide repeat protein [unclassified Massilia]MBD8529493.1 tetratricopeptide repeat protein [Massilia sp. CFBP 13647]MBD8672886.1 tetratricopeptide repeat protein [Massilia sp. CFBP 13721]
MSLINKMLQDLDARGTTRADGVPPEIKTVATGTRRPAPLRIAAIAAAVLVLAGGAVAWFVLPLEGDTYRPVQPQPVAPAPAAPPATVAEVAPAPVAEAPLQAPVADTAPPLAADTVEVPPPPVKKDVAEPVRNAPAERPRQPAPVAAAPQPAGSTTSWAVASERARAERARLNARWQAERERLAALPPDQRRAGEVKLREEQARAAERAKIETAWLASLARREAGGADIPAAPTATRAAEPAAVAATPAARGQGRVETSSQGAENAYRRALASLQDGRVGEAIAGLQQTLRANPRHEAARQTLVSLLIENNRGDEAMTQLQQALTLDPRQPALAMLLARLQIERGKGGIETLQRTLPYATGNGEYHAFLGGALQRQGRLSEAAEQYETALRTAPNNAVWWMGLGIALQGEKRTGEAADAFRQAKSLGTLSPDLQAFVERRLQQLGR